jgi:hypothetical protein
MFNRLSKDPQRAIGMTASAPASSNALILARRLARPLTAEEIEAVAGGIRESHTYAGGTQLNQDMSD